MTIEEAIDLLDNLIGMVDDNHDSDYDTAIKMAIKALEQKPCDDTVSRGVFEQVMWERDTAIEQLRKLGYELGQKVEPCEDCVSRQAVIDIVKKNCIPLEPIIIKHLEDLPPVLPKREQGEWIEEKHGYRCNKCNYYYKGEWSITDNAMMPQKHCPNCGTEMKTESED